MSFANKCRNVQATDGKDFPGSAAIKSSTQMYAEILSNALKRQFAGSPCAMKSIVRITGANERSVKNWWTAKNGPSGEHLITLARHSDEVLEAILILAGRQAILSNKKVSDVRRILGNCITDLNGLMAEDALDNERDWIEISYFLAKDWDVY